MIDTFMSYCYENDIFNGTICITEKDSILYRKAFGLADVLKKEELATDHVFYLASVSKPFTTMAIMILKEQKRLNYYETLQDYFPEFPPYASKITVQHLMTHTSGLSDHFKLGIDKPNLTNGDVLNVLIKQDSPNFEPGEKYSYSNGGYVMLAMIIEKTSNKTLHAFMKENIFDPLRMKNSLVYDESKPQIAKRAIGYNIFREDDDYHILTTGAGGIFSTVEDLSKWNNALMNNRLIKRETLNEAYISHKLNNDSFTNYGYGWSINHDSLGHRVSHKGGLSGFRTYIERNLSRKTSFFYLTNFGNSIPMDQINEGLRNILHNKPYSLPKIPISKTLCDIIKSGGVEKAIDQYHIYKNESNKKYNFDEGQLDSLGYYLLGKKKIMEAIDVFKLNTTSYPEASSPYDSLGDAYTINEDYESAITNYKKSLELNPTNSNSEAILAKIEKLKKNV
ncbi:MAG: serine hydrolase [Planctomycetes bacterium]|nr:serine hydrolase [Planctomycetota bacterium]